MMKNTGIILVSSLALQACNTTISEDEASSIGFADCRKQPSFFKQSGFDVARSALSTSEKRKEGLVLVEFPAMVGENPRYWQHPSWSGFGFMGPITTDDLGNSYVAPVPMVNVLKNDPLHQNTLYIVKTESGEMSKLLEIPSEMREGSSVFGIMGLQFDCHSGYLLVTSVSGSSRDEVNGALYIVDGKTRKVHDELKGWDAIGISVSGVSGQKRIYFGLARKSEIWSVEMDKNGKFKGEPQLEISLDLLGPRGDDKARKIRFDKRGDMLVSGVEFNFNLTAPTEKQETQYKFTWLLDEKKWAQVK